MFTSLFSVMITSGATVHGMGSDLALHVRQSEFVNEILLSLLSSEPDIWVEQVADGALLRSASKTLEEIKDAWLCASINERFLLTNREARRSVLRDLLA